MRIRILGSAAGGGVPQWNCRCANCSAVRAGSADIQARTQSSVALSADGSHWYLLNVSPDIRQQILAFPELGPPANTPRGSAIAGCVLTDAELDHTAGLLLLREGTPLPIHCTAPVRQWLSRYLPIEPILTAFSRPAWTTLPLGDWWELPLPDGQPSGLRLRAFSVDDRAPRFVPEPEARVAGAVCGLEIEDHQSRRKLVYAPCVGSVDGPVEESARGADAVLIDGTFWDDEEPRRMGIGGRTARAMGHVPVSGPAGSLRWLSQLPVPHRVYLHINNTNPMLNRTGPEFGMVCEKGVRVAADGDEIVI